MNENLALRVFGIPELAKIICDLAQKCDNAKLLRVCHQLFQDVRPYVWESTDAVVSLIEMIPTSRVDRSIDEPFCPYVTLRFPTFLDFSRLNIYGPYIKRLHIPLIITVDEYHNWGSFLVSIQNADLLPNLEHLKLDIPSGLRKERIGVDRLNWMTTFMTASLQSVQILQDMPFDLFATHFNFSDSCVSLETTINILLDLSRKSPRLQDLAFFPQENFTQRFECPTHLIRKVGNIYPELIAALDHSSISSIHLTSMLLSRLHYLRKLTVTSFVLELKVFSTLSRLPYLESLSIRDITGIPPLYNARSELIAHLSEYSFPSLKNLHLFGLTWETCINLCKVEPLAKALRSTHPPVCYIPEHNQLLEFLNILVDHSSPITKLSLVVYRNNLIDEILSKKVLCSLHITHLTIAHLCRRGQILNWLSLLHEVPALESLRITNKHHAQALKLGELRLFATLLPRLTQLLTPLDFSTVLHLEDQDYTLTHLQSSSPFNLEVYYTPWHLNRGQLPETEFKLSVYVDDIARYLTMLWPKIGCTARRSKGDRVFEPPSDLNLLNDAIARYQV
ncbi:hypothetical protein RSOLAG1IB_09531 [Rhizoctonia solani AG-1 IB]|uniref:Uncharacterized protein n=1 Tax=Thanatephorus cucumeris (strain AG1-IB / isolate 7/3/14) TaxID=1108050 RepID=A0A0B7FVU7_THACB|nr:hypothetical protein RSOLAG1IB_09531 [Rhizoctonia solani AG-1 IB]